MYIAPIRQPLPRPEDAELVEKLAEQMRSPQTMQARIQLQEPTRHGRLTTSSAPRHKEEHSKTKAKVTEALAQDALREEFWSTLPAAKGYLTQKRREQPGPRITATGEVIARPFGANS